MGFLILSLLSAAVLGTVAFDWSDGDDDSHTDSPPQDGTDEDAGQVLSYDGSEHLEGTEGNDTLPAGQDPDLAPAEIDLLGGDDAALLDYGDSMTVSGGDGDDVILTAGASNTLDGGAGNDTLAADDSNRLIGGTGDDELDFFHESYDQGDPGGADGGEGDDTINVWAAALVPDYLMTDVGGVEVHGGSGADDINVTYGLHENVDTTDTLAGGFVSISDFDPSEDTLVIEVERSEETADRDVTVELDQTDEDGTYTSLITLTFEETEEASEATNTLTVVSTDPFTLDDIQLVGI